MPAPNPFPSPQQQAPTIPLPALNLFPLNDSFIPKHIHLQQRVKIGRQTNAKTVPGERNGYFDSKVLSRQHAEVWEETGKIYIKDVKSSNGTFINGERLSAEGVESDPFELKTDDIVEFGIDIVGEDNKTIIHHKVAARVTCVLTPDDAPAPAPPSTSAPLHPSAQPAPRRPGPGALAPTSSGPAAGLGSMGAPAGAGRPTAKNGLTFEHILSRLQSGLMQSRETGAELGRLGDQMGDISDTLGGNNVRVRLGLLDTVLMRVLVL
ncbi:SMAD/FHA domain-containing protein [Ramaria rubella]|nr:SMAD/FHA domain-containing protein [Ramaria rubella]